MVAECFDCGVGVGFELLTNVVATGSEVVVVAVLVEDAVLADGAGCFDPRSAGVGVCWCRADPFKDCRGGGEGLLESSLFPVCFERGGCSAGYEQSRSRPQIKANTGHIRVNFTFCAKQGNRGGDAAMSEFRVDSSWISWYDDTFEGHDWKQTVRVRTHRDDGRNIYARASGELEICVPVVEVGACGAIGWSHLKAWGWNTGRTTVQAHWTGFGPVADVQSW